MWLVALQLSCSEPVFPCESPLGSADLDCDGVHDRDGDGDGAVSSAHGGDDCDDADPLLNPTDADGDDASTCAGDCNDADPAIGPRGVTEERCDDLDNDCNGVVDVDDLGIPACLEHDRALQPPRLRLDLLVVIDDTPSMQDEGSRLRDAGDAVFAILDGTDTHVGVITNNAEDPLVAGRLHDPIGGGDRYLTVLDATPAETRTWWRGATAVGAAGIHDDSSFDAVYSAISVNGDTFNAGFYREDADLAVWLVTDSNDNSSLLSKEEFEGWLFGLKAGTDRTVRVDGILPMAADACSIQGVGGTSLEEVVNETGGVVGTVCDLDWSPSATAITTLESPTTQVVVALSRTPIPATLTADLESTTGTHTVLPASALLYDPFSNTVTVPDSVWTELRSVTATYERLP